MSKAVKEEPPSRNWARCGMRMLGRMLNLHPHNMQGLTATLKRASQAGVLDRDLLTMIEGVFCISDMRVRDIMIPRPQMKIIHKEAPLDQILMTVADGAHSRFPVVGDNPDKIEGILHAKDLLRCFDQKNSDTAMDITAYLRPAVVVPESKRLKVLLEEFKKNRNHMAIVVDEYGGVAGLVTIEDVLEQIVGDIIDEYDVDEDNYIFAHKEGSCRVKALTPLKDFNKYFSSNLANGSADTVGGLVVSAFGHLPKRGESVEIGAFTFEVMRADDRRVHSLLVRKRVLTPSR